MVPGRSAVMAEQQNPDFVICEAAGQRLLRSALVHLLTGESGHLDTALLQIESLFDDGSWPKWLDQAHGGMGFPAGLRTGMLAKDVGFAFDWLHESLSTSEREFIVSGLDRKAIQPFFNSVEQGAWWMVEKNNWQTTIVGGLGIAGMALFGYHDDAETLVQMAEPVMQDYLSIYGEAGEFNESIAYANATERPVNFFGALRYALEGENTLAASPFAEACRWLMYLTVPPGRSAAFGDGHVEARPWIKYVAAVAAATGDGILQWFYLQHAQASADPLELLWYDDSVVPVDPQGRLPLARVFPAHGGCISSRTDWNQQSTPCVVYGKFGREENHEHNDVGQLCIDGYGERLIVDLGSPSSYPADFFSEARWSYYNASVLGHNVFMFGDGELRVPATDAHTEDYSGRLLASEFDEQRGGFWQLDLTAAYGGATAVKRTVVHLLPGTVIVLDEALLEEKQNISMRWHTREAVVSDAQGRFAFEAGEARMTGLLTRLDGDCHILGAHHRYEPPYHRGRAGDLLEQRHEPFIEMYMVDRTCRLLSLFNVSNRQSEHVTWEARNGRWYLNGTSISVWLNDAGLLRVENEASGLGWSL